MCDGKIQNTIIFHPFPLASHFVYIVVWGFQLLLCLWSLAFFRGVWEHLRSIFNSNRGQWGGQVEGWPRPPRKVHSFTPQSDTPACGRSSLTTWWLGSQGKVTRERERAPGWSHPPVRCHQGNAQRPSVPSIWAVPTCTPSFKGSGNGFHPWMLVAGTCGNRTVAVANFWMI